MKALAEMKSRDYAAYIEAGICPTCKSTPITHPERVCPSCQSATYERNKARTAGFRAEELCLRCGGDSGGKSICEGCARKARIHRVKTARRRAAEKLCTRCGGEIEHGRDGRTRCGKCAKTTRDIRRAYEARKSERGECLRCSKQAAPDSRLCPDCIQSERERSRKRKR